MFFCLIALENIKSVNHMFGLKKTNAVGFAMFQMKLSIRTMLKAIMDQFTRLQS